MASILIRSVITYLLLIFSMKLMGKRQIGELEINELVGALLISEIASMPITEPDIPLMNAIIPIFFIVSAEILVSHYKNKSAKLKKLIEGEPVYIIYKGRILQEALSENRISINEVLCEMRMQSIFDISTVEYALLEQNGNISFYKSKNSDKITHSIILDGEINKNLLSRLGYDFCWLKEKLSNYQEIPENVFLFTVDDNENTNLVRKDLR